MDEMTVEQYRELIQSHKQARNKYNAKKVEYQGYTFDSQSELRRYLQLSAMQENGEIRDLELQPEFLLQPAFTGSDGTKYRAIKYKADFRYTDALGYRVVEDVKGMQTTAFRIRWRLALYKFFNYHFRIVEA